MEPDFAMGVLLRNTAVSSVEKIVQRLKFSRAEMHHIVALVENLPQFSRIRQMPVATLKRFFRLNRFEDHIQLARIHRLARSEDLGDVNYILRKRAEWTDQDIFPEPLLTGDDLIAMGFKPGPSFKDILTRLEEEQLEGRLAERSQALEFIQRHYS
jgi:poly(A) polymerase